MPAMPRARYTVPATIAFFAVIMTGCGSSAAAPDTAARSTNSPQATTNAMGQGRADVGNGMNGMRGMGGKNGMSGMGPMAGGKGLRSAADGYHMTSRLTTLAAASHAAYTFTITEPGGAPLTRYATDMTKKLHFYAIRSDLTGFQHIHPVMAPSGTWTAPLAALTPGRWRLYASFIPATGPRAGTEFFLSRTITVPGPHAAVPLPPPAVAVTNDGYTITTSGNLMPGMAMPLRITITRHGRPVTTLQPWLGSYAHLTAIHAGDLAFAHLHPEGTTHGDHGGPTLIFNANLPETGPWRLFLQFRAGGRVHTAPITINS